MYTCTMSVTFNNPAYTLANLTVTGPTRLTNPTWTVNHPDDRATLSVHDGSGLLDLRGPRADVVINGHSLGESIQAIEEALLIPGRLTQNHQLEQEFVELKELGELYRRREQEFLEKRRVWNILKTTDQ